MRKKYVLAGLAGLVVLALAVVVYAWVYDTDGGYNPWDPGTCIDNNLSFFTDFCWDNTTLIEFYPIDQNNCWFDIYPCPVELGSICHRSPMGGFCDWVG